jgi:hypothetical protein
MLAERFARMHVREVHFDERDPDGRQGIAQGDAGVRESRRIDEDVCSFVAFRSMNAVYQRRLGVALEARHLGAFALAQLDQPLVDRLQGVVPIVVVSRWPSRFRFGPEDQDLGMGGEFAATRGTMSRFEKLGEVRRGAGPGTELFSWPVATNTRGSRFYGFSRKYGRRFPSVLCKDPIVQDPAIGAEITVWGSTPRRFPAAGKIPPPPPPVHRG